MNIDILDLISNSKHLTQDSFSELGFPSEYIELFGFDFFISFTVIPVKTTLRYRLKAPIIYNSDNATEILSSNYRLHSIIENIYAIDMSTIVLMEQMLVDYLKLRPNYLQIYSHLVDSIVSEGKSILSLFKLELIHTKEDWFNLPEKYYIFQYLLPGENAAKDSVFILLKNNKPIKITNNIYLI